MENILDYYEFSSFRKDESDTFLNAEIAFSELDSSHFLIFERKKENFNLYISNYNNKTEIGVNPPIQLELLAENYDKNLPEHRLLLKRYIN